MMAEKGYGGNFMWNRKRSVNFSIVVCFIFVAILTAALFIGPFAVKWWFILYRGWSETKPALAEMLTIFKWVFFPSAAFAYIALYSLLKLLFNIKKDRIFISQNVTYLRIISWCCFAVAIVTLVGGILYIPYLVIAVAAAFVGLMLRVVKNVMQNAVEINQENELTI